MPSKIEWTDDTWNPVTGCTPVSEGCAHCYAARMANRLRGRYGYPADEPFRVTLHPDKLDQPFRWRKPRRIFVCSMGDLFHPDVPFEFVDRITATMMARPQHVFLVLTKRPERMATYFETWCVRQKFTGTVFPLPNLWLGVTAENQARWEERRADLFATPAAVHFVSYEPALGPLVLSEDDLRRLSWVVCGAESGPGARPMQIAWPRSLCDQCVNAGVKFFLKQMRVDGKLVKMPKLDGRVWNEMPEMSQ